MSKRRSSEESRNLSDSLVEILSGALIAFVGTAGVRLAGLIEKVLIARFLDPTRYGQVILSITILSLGSTLCMLGLKQGLVRYLPRFEALAKKQGIVMFALRSTVFVSLCFGAAVFVCADILAERFFRDPPLAPIVRIIALAVPLAVVSRVGEATAQGMKHPTWQTVIRKIVFPFSRVGIIVFFALIGLSTTKVAYAYVLGYGLAATLALYYIHRYIGFSLSYDVDRVMLLRFSLPLLFAGGMSFISNSVDTLLLGYFLTAERIGIYNAAYPLANLVLIAPALMSTMFIPIISEYHSDGDLPGMRSLYKINTRWVAILTLPGFYLMVLTPESFLMAVFGSEYVGGALSMLIIASGFLVFVLLGSNGGVVTMIGKSKVIMATTSVNATLNLGLNVVLIPRVGIEGAAVATAVSYISANLLVSAYLYLKVRIHPITPSLLLTPILLGGIVVPLYSVTSSFLSGFALIVVTYASVLATFLPIYVFSGISDETELSLVSAYIPGNSADLES